MLTYSIDTGAEGTFDIDRATGQLKTQGSLDADSEPTSYTVTVTATDPSGDPATAVVTITVTDVDEDPSIAASATPAISFPEGTADTEADITTALATYTATDPENETATWSKSGPDAGKFSISSGGELTFDAAPDFESPGDANRDNVYEVTVVAADSGRNSDELDVRVTVTNVAELGAIEFSSLQPKVGVPLTATLDDSDDDVTNLMWQWSNSATGIIEDETSRTYTPVADDIADMLTATATYRDGSLAAGDGAITLASDPMAVVVADTDNKAPVFPDQDTEMDGRQTDQKRTVAENTVSDTSIGDPVTATDKATTSSGVRQTRD